ncbi:TPA: DUF3265 domain-containing protein [Vibrio parahaemolyticus]|nr:DUF3265 domain-containing protein [Vibrio parahaemolyticus]HCG7315136.1 DUF3265 domain-containing protein [Vibrio parahaemolyticus]
MFQYLGVCKRFTGSVLTNNSIGIRNAWQFWHALVLVIKVVCRGFGVALLTP